MWKCRAYSRLGDNSAFTWHVAHAAQNGPGFDIEGLFPFTEALVDQVDHIVWAHVTPGAGTERGGGGTEV